MNENKLDAIINEEVVQPQDMGANITGDIAQPQEDTGAGSTPTETVSGLPKSPNEVAFWEEEQQRSRRTFRRKPETSKAELVATSDEGNAETNNTEEAGQNPQSAYKSFETREDWQSEVDRIIGQRLGDTRELKNRAEEYDRLAGQLKQIFGTDNTEEALNAFTQQYAETMSAQYGISPEQFLRQQETESKARQFDRLQEEQKAAFERSQRMSVIDRQVGEFKAKNPDFDMGREVEDAEFCKLIWEQGLTVEDAYYLRHRDEIYKQAQSKVVENIAANQGRIPENGAGKVSPTVNKINSAKLSDGDIDNILERVANGEVIQF